VLDPSGPWKLQDFEDRFDEWLAQETTHFDLRWTVLSWVFTRSEDPYQGARRADGFPNLWFAVIPLTSHGGSSVVCRYWISESERSIRCDGFATLSEPI
jgi:hypothetical protein